MASPLWWMRSAIAYPLSIVIPGSVRASVPATCSNVLWSSLRTITRQAPPSALSGPEVRGSSMVCGMTSSCSELSPARRATDLGSAGQMPHSAAAFALGAVGLGALARLHASEHAAREARARLEKVLERGPGGIALFDRDLRYTHVNEALAAMGGRPVAEHLGLRPS